MVRSASVNGRSRIQRLPQVVMNFLQLAESDACGEEALRRERHYASLIAAIVCRIWQDRTRLGPSKRQQPPRVSNITETEAWHDFRFRAEEFSRLVRALLIPRRVVLRSGSTFNGETALLLLRRMRKALLCLLAPVMSWSLLIRSFSARNRPPYL